MYKMRKKKINENTHKHINTVGTVPLFPFNVLSDQIAVVILKGDFSLGRFV